MRLCASSAFPDALMGFASLALPLGSSAIVLLVFLSPAIPPCLRGSVPTLASLLRGRSYLSHVLRRLSVGL